MGCGAAAIIPALYHHKSLAIPLFPGAFGLGIYGGLHVFYRFLYDGISLHEAEPNILPNPANPS